MMKAEIISIGDEILIGQTINTNASYLSRKLTALGLEVQWITVVGDNFEDLQTALKLAFSRADIIITTGGLGPTHDDISKKVISEYFNARLIMNDAVLKNVERIFRRLGRRIDAVNREQALVPENARVLSNRIGTAPGLLIEHAPRRLFVLPGVPMEMKAIFEDHIEPFLASLNTATFISLTTINTTGIFESKLFNLVKDIVFQIQDEVKVAFLPSPSGVNIRLSVRGTDKASVVNRLQAAKALFEKRLGNNIYGYDEDVIEKIVAELFLAKKMTVALVDVYTGGILSNRILEVTNANQFFKGGIVLPLNQSTINFDLFNKQRRTTSPFKPPEQCEWFAQRVKEHFNASLGLAIVPDEKNKNDVLQIYCAVAGDTFDRLETYPLRMARTDNKERVAQFTLNMLRLLLQNR